MGLARGKDAQRLRNPLVWTVPSYFHPCPGPTQAQLESMPGSLSESNGLSGSLVRLRRGRRNSNIDLFGTGRSTVWGNRGRAIIKLAWFCDLLGAETWSQCMAEKVDEWHGKSAALLPPQNNKAGSQG